MLSIVGDVFLDRHIDVKSLGLTGALLVNCEHAITQGGESRENKICLRSDQNRYQGVFNNCQLIAALANNHILDYGPIGAQATLDSFSVQGVETVGLEKNKTIEVSDDGFNYYIYNYAMPDTNSLYDDLYLKNTSPDEILVNGEIGFHVIYVHWGEEEITRPSAYQITLARKFIDAGFDLVVGCHSHIPGPIERYKEKYIFYSLGNFFFPDLSVSYHDGVRRYTIKKVQRQRNRTGIIVSITRGAVSHKYFKISRDDKYSYFYGPIPTWPRFVDSILAKVHWIQDNRWIIKRKLLRMVGLYD
jgi:poly-gamma-glutamate synthesis protein (capsule biosynthesis protein)